MKQWKSFVKQCDIIIPTHEEKNEGKEYFNDSENGFLTGSPCKVSLNLSKYIHLMASL